MEGRVGEVRDVWLGGTVRVNIDMDLLGIRSRSRVGSSRETRKWILKS